MGVLLYRDFRDGNSTVERLEMGLLLYKEFRDGHSTVQRD